VSLEKIEPAPDVARLAGLLERLVAIDTQNPPGREAEAAALIASQLEAIGFVTKFVPLQAAVQMSLRESTTAPAPF
jgi:acetylornithine deacetylase/succinyl-diaminopimelate desuccinylase-like protein